MLNSTEIGYDVVEALRDSVYVVDHWLVCQEQKGGVTAPQGY